MREIKIIERYRPYLLLDISYELAKENINIESINSTTLGELVVINLYVDPEDYEKALKVLESNYKVIKENDLVVELEDKPGELARLLKILSQEGIDVFSTDVVSKKGGKVYLSLTTSDNAKAASLLSSKGYQLVVL
ncbi:MAG: hypothetical protein GXN92_01850 [Candidatus Micrarchaeota archaeon]|nr:hypothetical protein [Candidatus Micrarchaeota archaeon]